MKLKVLLTLVLILAGTFAFCQKAADSLLKLAQNHYTNKEYIQAASLLTAAGEAAKHRIIKSQYFLYAAHAYAKAADSSNSFKYLQLVIHEYDFHDKTTLESDDSFTFMHQDKRWNKLIRSIKAPYTTNPRKAKFIDQDVHNFWRAYDSVQKAPDQAEAIYNALYFDRATNAMQFYYANKIGNTRKFVSKQKRLAKYYPSIRASTLKATGVKESCRKSFARLKKLYPQAIFPDTYFVVGGISSAGTVSGDGLILGIDQAVMSPDADTAGLTLWEFNNISAFKDLPYTIAHELIHYQQNQLAGDTTLLCAAITEGMADFIGELISGKTSNPRLFVFAKGKEKQIWDDFKKEMLLNKADNWIANSIQETAEKPADLGYWVGYQICKAYYENAADKKKAIFDMLHIKNYADFLAASKIDEKFSN